MSKSRDIARKNIFLSDKFDGSGISPEMQTLITDAFFTLMEGQPTDWNTMDKIFDDAVDTLKLKDPD
jgi:hypothetical protein